MSDRKAVHDLTEKYCRTCEVYRAIKTTFTLQLAQRFCLDQCPIGRGLSNIGKVLEYGVPIRVGQRFSEEDYKRLSETYSDKEICDRVGLSTSTLHRRKVHWGVKDVNPIEHFTLDEYHDLKLMRYSDDEIAKMKGFSSRRLRSWKTKHHVRAPSILTELLITKTKEDFYAHVYEGLSDEEIASLWKVSERTLRRWRAEKGIRYQEETE